MNKERKNVKSSFLLLGYIVSLCIIAIVLSSKGITDESVISMNGDMPRYLMNGVYFYDLASDFPVSNPFAHVSRYFAKYPALSLGHHPLLLGLAEVPFYAIFGISIFSARLTIVFFLLLAALSLFFLVKRIYGNHIAFISALLFVTTPFIIEYSQIVMAEIPTIALTLFATYFFYRYCESERALYAFITALSLVLSLYSKQAAVFIIPIFLFYLLLHRGPKVFLRKELILASFLIVLLLIPLVFITLKFSRVNVAWVTNAGFDYKFSFANLIFSFQMLGKELLTLPVLLISLISILLSLLRKDKRSVLFFFWIISCYLSFIILGLHKNARYVIFWVPVFCVFAATLINACEYRFWKIGTSILLLLTISYQFVIAYRQEAEYTDGYEETAQYIVEYKKGESVLYQEIVDTGYFIFFVRKHDPGRNLIVLRTDKILATSIMDTFAQDRINSREQIYEVLQKYGVGYVVLEDKKSESCALEWLREEVKSDKFILRKEVLLRSNDDRLNNIPLAIYEYKDYTPPKEGVMLDMDIPLMDDSIQIPFKDLL
ncbi:4-amino-4-deoxy-L-arabinose transferase and related glycosyltransferase of PMT family-like [Candidatus Vecturithrix granuli]|uniref:4-amino-4-deoxy-L-arabinose transferase and related glycosyltransferase of PMT family-like n=1 Tax=Vecturithrix granuli TaxID=1499967 RepID=A0A081C2M5_VECG1|nr:4-amino-4-deoxy-L-arabinose transferase and related glycosyltransferase of PMT family-like [Candidatus Vecturithrix granuli]